MNIYQLFLQYLGIKFLERRGKHKLIEYIRLSKWASLTPDAGQPVDIHPKFKDKDYIHRVVDNHEMPRREERQGRVRERGRGMEVYSKNLFFFQT